MGGLDRREAQEGGRVRQGDKANETEQDAFGTAGCSAATATWLHDDRPAGCEFARLQK